MGLETTLKRPIVNTRDEPHADPIRLPPSHVIVGDANLAEVATFLKVGHHRARPGHDRGRRAAGRAACNFQSGDGHAPGGSRPDPSRALLMADGIHGTALAIQWELFSLARKYADDRGLDCIGPSRCGEEVLTALGGRPPRARERPDGPSPPARLGGQAQLIEAYRDRHGWMGRPPPGRPRPTSPRPAAVRSLFARTGHRAADRDGQVASAVADAAPRRVPGSGVSAWSAGEGSRHRQLGFPGL